MRRLQDWLVPSIGPDLISDRSGLAQLINLLFMIDITRAVLLHHHHATRSIRHCCVIAISDDHEEKERERNTSRCEKKLANAITWPHN